MASTRTAWRGDGRVLLAAAVGLALIGAAIASDFVVNSFWAGHAMLTALLANLVVVGISVVVVNALLERRGRRRWSLLAQSVFFALLQSARLTWTTLVELLDLTEVRSGAVESLLEGAQVAVDTQRVSAAARELMADPERRQRLQRTVHRLSQHANEVIASWATVMVGAAPYAELFDRHVELQSRLEWLSSVLAHNEPAPDQGRPSRRLNLANVATEQADAYDDDWIHDMVVSITALATRLDYESREQAFSLVSADWWAQRTQVLVEA